MSTPRRKAPQVVLEGLRLMVVVFFAGAGYQIGSGVWGDQSVLGPFNGIAVGLILGSGLGYVLGGVLGRTTASSAEVARVRLAEASAEELVAGALGTVGGVLLGAGVAWPVFLLRQSYLSFPLVRFRLHDAGLRRLPGRREQVTRACWRCSATGPAGRPRRWPPRPCRG